MDWLRRLVTVQVVGVHGSLSSKRKWQHASGKEPSASSKEPYGFRDLCGSRFVVESWTRKSLAMEPGLEAVGHLFDVSDLASLLYATNRSLKVMGGGVGETSSVSPQPNKQKGTVADFFRNASLTLMSIDTKLPRLAIWVREFTRTFGIVAAINMYLTPPNAQAFSLHNDGHDVLAAQVTGSKAWKVWDFSDDNISLFENLGISAMLHPFTTTEALVSADSPTLKVMPVPSLATHLIPGSLLYVPRGSFHVASTAGQSDKSSLHLTIALKDLSFGSALFIVAQLDEFKGVLESVGWSFGEFDKALTSMSQEEVGGIDFRQGLPLGFVFWAFDRTQGLLCKQGMSDALLRRVRSRAEELLGRVLARAPAPPAEAPRLSQALLRAAAAPLVQKLEDFRAAMQPAAGLQPPPQTVAIELPEELHISFAPSAAGDDVDVRFTWCHAAEVAIEVQWPSAVLSMLKVVAASRFRQIALSELGGGGDPVPTLLFAVMLAQLPLKPAVQLLGESSVPWKKGRRSPNCTLRSGARTASTEL